MQLEWEDDARDWEEGWAKVDRMWRILRQPTIRKYRRCQNVAKARHEAGRIRWIAGVALA